MIEAPAVVAGFDDVAMVGNTVEQCGGHLGVAKDGRPLAKGEVRGDDDGGLLVELADQMDGGGLENSPGNCFPDGGEGIKLEWADPDHLE